MQKKINIAFTTFILEEKLSIINFQLLLESLPYDNEKGYGFKKVEVNKNVLNGILLKRNPVFINEYDLEKNEIIEKSIFIYTEVKFAVDFEFKILYSFGNISSLGKLTTVLRIALQMAFQSDNIHFRLDNILPKLEAFESGFEIKEFTIKKFNYQNGALGKFAPQISNQKVGRDLLYQYLQEINKVCFQIQFFKDELVDITLTDTGTISITSDDLNAEGLLDEVKKLIFT